MHVQGDVLAAVSLDLALDPRGLGLDGELLFAAAVAIWVYRLPVESTVIVPYTEYVADRRAGEK